MSPESPKALCQQKKERLWTIRYSNRFSTSFPNALLLPDKIYSQKKKSHKNQCSLRLCNDGPVSPRTEKKILGVEIFWTKTAGKVTRCSPPSRLLPIWVQGWPPVNFSTVRRGDRRAGYILESRLPMYLIWKIYIFYQRASNLCLKKKYLVERFPMYLRNNIFSRGASNVSLNKYIWKKDFQCILFGERDI